MLVDLRNGRFVAADQIAEIFAHYEHQQITIRLKDGRELGVERDYGKTVSETVDRLVSAVNSATGG